MEKQRWEESEKRRAEERRSEKRKSGKKEDSGARKRSASRETAGAERSGQMKDEKLHAVVVRSTFGSEKIKAVSRSERFWRLSCGKRARHCGAKHIWTSKYARHTMVGPFFKVAMFKKRSPLWHETNFEVKMHKSHHSRATFGS
jgi:hypothetical protein